MVLTLLRGFFSGFPPSTKANGSKFHFDLDFERLQQECLAREIGRPFHSIVDVNIDYFIESATYGFLFTMSGDKWVETQNTVRVDESHLALRSFTVLTPTLHRFWNTVSPFFAGLRQPARKTR